MGEKVVLSCLGKMHRSVTNEVKCLMDTHCAFLTEIENAFTQLQFTICHSFLQFYTDTETYSGQQEIIKSMEPLKNELVEGLIGPNFIKARQSLEKQIKSYKDLAEKQEYLAASLKKKIRDNVIQFQKYIKTSNKNTKGTFQPEYQRHSNELKESLMEALSLIDKTINASNSNMDLLRTNLMETTALIAKKYNITYPEFLPLKHAGELAQTAKSQLNPTTIMTKYILPHAIPPIIFKDKPPAFPQYFELRGESHQKFKAKITETISLKTDAGVTTFNKNDSIEVVKAAYSKYWKISKDGKEYYIPSSYIKV